jgi:SAM-dependent methyltransferase
VIPVGSDAAGRQPAPPDVYASVAPFYDLGTEGFDEDESLYLGFAQRSRGPMLELGCGTGRLLAALGRAGFDAVGLDRSPAMLALARSRLCDLPAGASLLLGTMTHPPLRGGFGLIFVALDGFLHLATAAEQRACLVAVRELLDRDGRLLLDLPAPAAPGWEDWSPGVRPLVPAWSRSLSDGRRVTKLSTFDADASTQTHHVTELYDCVTADGGLRRIVVEYDLRFVFPAELELLLETCGLRLVDRYGGYGLEPFDAGSARQICVAARAGRR